MPSLSLQDGIGAARRAINVATFDGARCGEGLDALEQYQREWMPEKQRFGDQPRHDWCSHYADGFRYLGIDWRSAAPAPKVKPYVPPPPMDEAYKLDELWPTAKRSNRI